jgi:hypothetical protein
MMQNFGVSGARIQVRPIMQMLRDFQVTDENLSGATSIWHCDDLKGDRDPEGESGHLTAANYE